MHLLFGKLGQRFCTVGRTTWRLSLSFSYLWGRTKPNLISCIMLAYVFHASCFFKRVLLQCVYFDLIFQMFFWNVSFRPASHAFQIWNSSGFDVLWFIFRNVTVLPSLLEDTKKICWNYPFSSDTSVTVNVTMWCDIGNLGLALKKTIVWRVLKLETERFRMNSVIFFLWRVLSILTQTGYGFRFAKDLQFCGQMIFIQHDSRGRAWKPGIALYWRAYKRPDHPKRDNGNVGVVCGLWQLEHWTHAEYLLQPAFPKPEAGLSPQDPFYRGQGR